MPEDNVLMKYNDKSVLIFLTTILIYSSALLAELKKDVNANNGALSKSNVIAETEWTFGLGLGVFEYNLYPGAKQTNQLILPSPYFTYRSPKFEIDRGIKSFIYNSEEIVIDISADFGLPVDSDDTLARKGMPDLDFVVQLGPSLEFLLNDRRKNYFDARFEIPLRLAFTVNFPDARTIGYLLEPRISLNHKRIGKTGFSQKIVFGVKFASQEFFSYYYDVASEFVTPTRNEFESDAGFGGSFINYRISYKTKKVIYWLFTRYQSLRGAEFENSPLVLQNDYLFIGAGFSWILGSSN